jgi:hypothetical protein
MLMKKIKDNKWECLRPFALDDALPAYGSNLDWPRIYDLFDPYDMVKVEVSENHFRVIDLSDRECTTDAGVNWRNAAIGNIFIMYPGCKIYGYHDAHWEVIL